MVRGAIVAVSVVAWLMPASPAVGVTPLCAFDDGTGVVAIHMPVQAPGFGDPVVMVRAGDAIVVDGEPCGDATVMTTDSILVDGEPQPEPLGGGHRFEIDLSGGPFAPGRTDEGDGSSEIEMTVDTGPSAGDRVTIRGSAGADTILVDGPTVNLDGAPDDTPDVRLLQLHDVETDEDIVVWDRLSLALRGGGDEARVTGTTGDLLSSAQVDVRAGDGDDQVIAHIGEVWGGRGNDRLEAHRNFTAFFGGPGDDELMTTGSRGIASFDGGGGRDLLVGGKHTDSLTGDAGDDELRGRGDNDFLSGSRGDDRLWGGSGRDRLRGEDGDDLLRGGAGYDYLYGGPGRDRCDAEPHDLFVSGCAGPPLGRFL